MIPLLSGLAEGVGWSKGWPVGGMEMDLEVGEERLGRLYGPKAAEYIRSHHKSTLASRLRIAYGRVAK